MSTDLLVIYNWGQVIPQWKSHPNAAATQLPGPDKGCCWVGFSLTLKGIFCLLTNLHFSGWNYKREKFVLLLQVKHKSFISEHFTLCMALLWTGAAPPCLILLLILYLYIYYYDLWRTSVVFKWHGKVIYCCCSRKVRGQKHGCTPSRTVKSVPKLFLIAQCQNDKKENFLDNSLLLSWEPEVYTHFSSIS